MTHYLELASAAHDDEVIRTNLKHVTEAAA